MLPFHDFFSKDRHSEKTLIKNILKIRFLSSLMDEMLFFENSKKIKINNNNGQD